MSLPMNREEAYGLLLEHTQSESLIKHALSVEGAMRYFARLYGEDPEYWGMVGLLHDLDYEKYPEEHCKHTPVYLKEKGFDEAFICAVLSHGYGLCTDVVPEHQMEKVILTVDELVGFLTACAYMRPSKSVMDMELKSVKKKFKTLNFAAAVNREHITKSAEMMGMPLDEVMEHCILAMREIADSIGLGMTEQCV